MCQNKSDVWRPQFGSDLALNRQGIDTGPLGVPVTGALLVDPLSPVVIDVRSPWIRLVSGCPMDARLDWILEI